MRGDRVYAGAPQNNLRGNNTGSVNVFVQVAPDLFMHVATLLASDAYALDNPDQIVMADIRPTAFHASGTGWVGLMTRYLDTRNYYYVLLTDDNRASLRNGRTGASPCSMKCR